MKNLKKRKAGILSGISNKYFLAIVCCMVILAGSGITVVSMILTEPAAKSQPLVTDLPTAIEVMDDDGMNRIQPYLRDDIVLEVTKQLGGSSTKKEFLEAYLALDTNDDLVAAIIDAGDNAERRRLPE